MHACALGLNYSWLLSNGQIGITIFFQRGPTFPSVRKSNCGKDGRAMMLASARLSWTVQDTVVVMPLSIGPTKRGPNA